jgi:hypothetical protein
VTALGDARARFGAAGLPFPPIPADLAAELREVGEFLFGTRDDGPGPYSIDWYVGELLGGRCTEPYVLTGHDGRGMNSWAIHYLLVHGSLAVFDQIAWGGAYSADADATRMMEVHWTQIGDMIDAAAAASSRGAIEAGERYVVVLSDFYGSRWARWSGGEPDWRRGGSPLATLLDAVIDVQELVET